MKSIVLTISILIGFFAYTQTIELFTLNQYTTANNTKTGFISLSDIYANEQFMDSIGILPENPTDIQRVMLTDVYRKRLLQGTKTAEKDTVYLYNYETNALVKMPVSYLKSIAKINMYADVVDAQNTLSPDDFMFGFEVNHQVVTKLGNEFRILVSIGKSNPFQLTKLQPFVWKKISANEFPFSQLARNQPFDYPIKDLKFHYYKSENYQYFVVSEILSSDMIILDLKGNKINEISFGSSESCSLTALSEDPNIIIQFVGSLFKNLPEVFLGFEELEASISCTPIIYFVDPHYNYISINSDYKHRM